MNKHYPSLGFIGAGNMARCLIGGLINNHYPPQQIWASNPTQEKLNYLSQQYNIHATTNNAEACQQSNIIVLAVKPQVIPAVLKELASVIQNQNPLLISIAAGITEKKIHDLLGFEVAIVRCMPNIPAFVSSGATGMYANRFVSHAQKDFAESIFRSIGITQWVSDEALMDVIGALSGAGPAYFFLMIEALEDAATELGLNRDDAHLLALQTALGAAHLALSTSEPIADLRARVTSKGGITEKALTVLESDNIRKTFAKALNAAYERSKEIAAE